MPITYIDNIFEFEDLIKQDLVEYGIYFALKDIVAFIVFWDNMVITQIDNK